MKRKILKSDDLEMDFVAALEQQIHRTGGGGGGGTGISADAADAAIASAENGIVATDANYSPKEMRKQFDSKKRWKNWGWKYSPGKTSSIEEEPIELLSSSSAKTSRHSSPTSSPKHKKSNDSTATTTAANVVTNLLNQSPLRRRPQSGQSRNANGKTATNQAPNQNGNSSTNPTSTSGNAVRNIDVRSSAGARLCQTLENLDDDEDDEFQALIINGRPASVHIVPMSSTQLQ